MTQDQLLQLTNLKRSVEAMKAAGQSDDLIVDRIAKRTDIPDQIKSIFGQAKSGGFSTKAVSDFLSLPIETKVSVVSKEDFRPKGALGVATEITGVRALGQFGGAQLAKFDPQHRKILRELKEQGREEEAKLISMGGVTGRELLGSVLQTAGTLALPFAGRALTAGALGQRVVASGATQAGFGAAASLAEGKSDKQIQNAALFGGVLGAAIPLGGVIFRGLKSVIKNYPKSAYTKIFRNTVDDVAANMMTKAKGKIVNPTLAEEMLHSGRTLGKEIVGSADEMGTALASLRNEIGKQLDPIAIASKAKIPVGDRKHLTNVLNAIMKGFDEGLVPKKVEEVRKYINFLNKVKPKTLTPKQALDLKQFIDSARVFPSIMLNKNLEMKQAAFKTAADYFRGQLHKLVPELGAKLKAYRISTEGFSMIVKEAVREGNQALLNRLDAIALGAGVAVGQPAVAGVAAGLIRATRSPELLTKSAQTIRKLTEGLSKEQAIKFGKRTLGIGSLEKNIEQAGRLIGRRSLTEIGEQ